MKKKFKRRVLFISLLPLGILLKYILSLYPEIVEKIYSSIFYAATGQIISKLFSVFPFSAAEIGLIAIILLVLFMIIKVIAQIIKNREYGFMLLKKYFFDIITAVCIMYFLFLCLWGFNYQREPFSTIANLDVHDATVSELYNVCEDIINRANNLRAKVAEDNSGCMYIPGGFKSVSERALYGYSKASTIYPELKGSFSNPKPVIFSTALSYSGIAGVFCPFTGEADVNVSQPDSMLPNTACHEMAHQRGFAREDEANYISYFVCSINPDYDFQYSGMLSALINCMNALYKHNPALYKKLSLKYSPGVTRDLRQNNLYWQRYQGPVQEFADKINDTYLKSNFQQDGVYSYGRMVDLIIAEYRKKASK